MNCEACTTRHCNGCEFDPTKESLVHFVEKDKSYNSERKPDLCIDKILFRLRFDKDLSQLEIIEFSFSDGCKVLDDRIRLYNNNYSSRYIVANFPKLCVNHFVNPSENSTSFKCCEQQVYEFEELEIKLKIPASEILGIGRAFSSISKFFAYKTFKCILDKLGNKQEIFPVKSFNNNAILTGYNEMDDILTFRIFVYVGVKR